MEQDIIIRKLNPNDEIPYDLLLIADATIEAIDKYIHESDIYELTIAGTQHGVFALLPLSHEVVELKNIAVSDNNQGKGLGSRMLTEIKKIAKHGGYSEIHVGTPSTGIQEISFYERNGFKIFDLKKDFFVENYSEPVIDNGVVLKDMVMLKVII